MKNNLLTTLSLLNLNTNSNDDANQIAGISTEDLAQVTGGYHDPVPSSDTGTAGLNPAPCTPSRPNPNPQPTPVWVLI